MQKNNSEQQGEAMEEPLAERYSALREDDRLSLLSQLGRLASTVSEQTYPSDIQADIHTIRESYRASIEIIRIYPFEPEQASPTNPSNQIKQEKVVQQFLQRQNRPQAFMTQISSSVNIESLKSLGLEENREKQYITIVVILAASKQICEVQCVVNKDKIKTIPSSNFQFQSQCLSISLFKINPKELSSSKIRYHCQKISFLLFTKKVTEQVSLENTRVYGKVGILLHNTTGLQQKQPLINFGLLQAHQYLANYLSSLKSTHQTILKEFYELFLRLYDAGCPYMKEVFDVLLIDDRKCTRSEYFLYLMYLVYRQKAGMMIKEYSLLGKLRFNSESIPRILDRKCYEQFQNSQCLKDFVLFTIMQYAVAEVNDNRKILISIARACIENLNQIRVRQIFNLLSGHPVMISLLDSELINRKFIENNEIPLEQYLPALLEYTQVVLLKAAKKSSNLIERMTLLILSMLKRINLKAINCKTTEQQHLNLEDHQRKLYDIFFLDGTLNVDPLYLGEVYVEVKFLLNLYPPLGEVLLRIVKPVVMSQAPGLLRNYFRRIIYPLVTLPEQKEENKILLNHCLEQDILLDDFICMLEVVLHQENHLYNHQLVKFVIFKFISFNPSFQSLELEKIRAFIGNLLQKKKSSPEARQFISQLCDLIAKAKKNLADRQIFSYWWATAKLGFAQEKVDTK